MENATNVPSINLRDFRKKLLPTKPRIFVAEYDNYNDQTKREMNDKPEEYKKFWFHPEVAAYIETKGMIIGKNWSNRRTLMMLREEAEQRGEDTSIHDGLLAEFDLEDYLFPSELKQHQEYERRLVSAHPEVQSAASKVGGQVTGGYKRKDWNND